ncbi:MAG: tetratricopeptide repeat protein, partial [Nitrospinae bacterium]|nr:tetratricopeptide repeat protein [Nitrospinota bacterium]
MRWRFFLLSVFIFLFSLSSAGESFAQGIKKAGVLYNEKRYEQAYSEFEGVHKGDPNNMDALNGMAWSSLQMGKIDDAERMFKDIIRKLPYHAGAQEGMLSVNTKRYERLNEAWSWYAAGDFNKATQSFVSIIQDKKRLLPERDLWRAYLGLGYSYSGNKLYKDAGDAFKESLKLQDNYDAHRGIGLAEFQTKNFQVAIKSFNSSLKLNPVQYDLKSMLAWSLFRAGSNAEAIKTFKEQIAVNPYDADIHYGLALTLHQKGDRNNALNEFYTAINILPGYVATEEFLKAIGGAKEYKDLYEYLGWSLYHAGLYKNSLNVFESGIKEYQKDADLLRGAGYASLKTGKYNEAIEFCSKSLSINPGIPPVYETAFVPETGALYRLFSDAKTTSGWAFLYKNDYAKAEDTFVSALKSHPDWADANSGLGWVYYSLKKYNEAEEQFNKAIKLDPAYADAYGGITAVANARLGKSGEGWKYYYLGQYDKAKEFFGNLLKDASLSVEAKENTMRGSGWSNLMLKNYNDAEGNFNALLKENSNDSDAILGMGYAAYNKNNFAEGISYLKKAVRSFPLDVNAEIALGWSYYKTGDGANSLIEFRRAVQLNPYLAEPHRGVGFSLIKIGRGDEGRASIISAINIYPEVVDNGELTSLIKEKKGLNELYISLAWSYYTFGKWDNALKTIEIIKKENITYPELPMLAGYIQYKKKDYDNAIGSLTAFLKGAPASEMGFGKYSESFLTLGWSYYNKQNYDMALQSFKKLSELHKADDIWAAPYDGMGWTYLKKG